MGAKKKENRTKKKTRRFRLSGGKREGGKASALVLRGRQKQNTGGGRKPAHI